MQFSNSQIFLILFISIFVMLFAFTEVKGNRQLYYFGVFTLMFGHRGIYIGPQTYLLPIEIIIFLLFIVNIFSNKFKKDTVGNNRKIPLFLTLFTLLILIFGVSYWITGTPLDQIMDWSIPLAIGWPTFWITRKLIQTVDHLKSIINIYLVVGIIISILAIIEFYFPQATYLLPGFFSLSSFISQEGFQRSAFQFWGYPIGAVLVTWSMIILYFKFLSPGVFRIKFFHLLFFTIGGISVYISGQRSSWVALIISILFISIFFKLYGIIVFGIFSITLTLFPEIFWKRLETVTVFLNNGTTIDTSIGSRIDRWSWGWNTLINNPLTGSGYGHWLVHNFFLEIGSTIGIGAALLFVFFLIQLLHRIYYCTLQIPAKQTRQIGIIFSAISITWIMQLNVETVFQTPPLGMAFWPIMAIAWYLPDIINNQVILSDISIIERTSIN